MSMDKTMVMAVQPPEERIYNFDEVALGYGPVEAIAEAARCLQCRSPRCKEGCPVGVPIPEFIVSLASGDFERAYKTLKSANSLPAVCGRVCPQEEQCEKKCILGNKKDAVSIGRLERFVADWAIEHEVDRQVSEVAGTGLKAAIVGAGPAGLTCAGQLAGMGVDVDVFEALHKPGGVLMYGIPEFRLPKALVEREVASLEAMGVSFIYDAIIGKTISVDRLVADYDAVFLGTGAGLPKFMNIKGEGLRGVYSANEYLTRINLMKAYEPGSPTPLLRGSKAVVIGGGNVAMDAARCAKRMGADVRIIYRRTMEELPARAEEVQHAIEEQIGFEWLCTVTEITGNEGAVNGIKCVRMSLGEPDASGRRRPKQIPDSAFFIEADLVIMAIGTGPNPLVKRAAEDLRTNASGGIFIEETCMKTSMEGVYAGGDAVTGAATVIQAMGAGKTAAEAMYHFMTGM